MNNKMIWGLAILIILLVGTGSVLFVRYHLLEIEKNKRQIAVIEAGSRSTTLGEGSNLSGQSSNYQKPPPGETEDTGYWEGNTWHITEPPKPKKEPFWKKGKPRVELIEYYNKVLGGPLGAPKTGLLRLSASEIHEYYSLVLQGVFGIDVRSVPELKMLLGYYPESPLILSHLAMNYALSDGEEAVAYAKKALRFLPTTSEDYSRFEVWRSPIVNSHFALSRGYQKLGDYEAALVHLKTTQRLTKGIEDGWHMAEKYYDACSREIAAIMAGKPLLGPDPVPEETTPNDSAIFVEQQISPVEVMPLSEEVFRDEQDFDFPADRSDENNFGPSDSFSSSDVDVLRAREASAQAEQAYQHFIDQKQQEFDAFMRWIETIEQASSPADLEDYLMRELATQMHGGSSEFMPDRLIRAFQTMHRHGDENGLIELEKIDPDIAEALLRHRRSQRGRK